MQRNGKTLQPASSKRRLADGRNAWKNMSDAQRAEFMQHIRLSVPSSEWLRLIQQAERVA